MTTVDIIDPSPPIELVPVADLLGVDDVGTRPQGLGDYACLARLDRAPSVDFLRRVTMPRHKPELGPRLHGGFALCASGAVLFTPQCCSSFSTLGDWEEALRAPEATSWDWLWIGHPCLAYRREGQALLLQGYIEPGDTAGCPLADEPIYRLRIDDLVGAISTARRACKALAPLLAVALQDVASKESPGIKARWLLGLGDQDA